jgi:hypothetical protein
MERLALQRMLFPSGAPPSPAASAGSAGPRPQQLTGEGPRRTSSRVKYTKQDDAGEVKRAAGQLKWLTGLSLGQHLAAGTWFFG